METQPPYHTLTVAFVAVCGAQLILDFNINNNIARAGIDIYLEICRRAEKNLQPSVQRFYIVLF